VWGAVATSAPPAARAQDNGGQVPRENHCITCHSEPDIWEGERRRFFVTEKDLSGDVHWQKGLRCGDCHGGDPSAKDFASAHSSDSGFHAVKSPADIPAFCGRCHSDIAYMRRFQPSPRTDQVAEYWTSGHGKRLKESGDPQVAVCTSCHGGKHKLYAVKDLESPVYPTRVSQTCAVCHSDAKVMDGRQFHGRLLGHNQYEEWRQSVHARALLEKGDLSAPSCNRCHGNHGAVPPEVSSVANACGTCHNKTARLFENTLMRHRFEQVELPGCATCHGNHLIRAPTDEMLGMGERAVCVKCHAEGRYGATLAGAEVARTLRDRLDKLNALITEAEEKIAEAERRGMEVSQPRYDLRNAFNARVNARTLVHTFSPDPVNKALDEGVQTASRVKEQAEAALTEYTARRMWLAASLLPIAIAIVFLVLYIRRLPLPAAGQAEH
jgi:predicted CXXCH cytochrome family protein